MRAAAPILAALLALGGLARDALAHGGHGVDGTLVCDALDGTANDGERGWESDDNVSSNPTAPTSGKTRVHTKLGGVYQLAPTGAASPGAKLGAMQMRTKGSDENLTQNATFDAITGLAGADAFKLRANCTYYVEARFIHNVASTTADIKYAAFLSSASGATIALSGAIWDNASGGDAGLQLQNGPGVGNAGSGTQFIGGDTPDGVDMPANINGYITTGSSASDLDWHAAQRTTAAVVTTIKAGSMVAIWEAACS